MAKNNNEVTEISMHDDGGGAMFKPADMRVLAMDANVVCLKYLEAILQKCQYRGLLFLSSSFYKLLGVYVEIYDVREVVVCFQFRYRKLFSTSLGFWVSLISFIMGALYYVLLL